MDSPAPGQSAPSSVADGLSQSPAPLQGHPAQRLFKQRQTRPICRNQHRQLSNREFIGVTEVDRAHVRAIHQADQAINKITDVAERTGLAATAIERQWFTAQCLHNEVAHNPAVIRQHAWAIGVEDARHPHLNAVHALIVETKRLCDALALVIATAHTNRID